MSRSRKVGSLTAGGMMVLFGVLFMIRIFIPWIDFKFILALWPIVLVSMGVEILIYKCIGDDEKMKFDGAAIGIMVLLAFFAMGMSMVQFGYDCYMQWYTAGI